MDEIILKPRSSPLSLNNETIILVLSLIVLVLSYTASVSSSYLPGKWQVGCCGKEFWWSPVSCSLLLVAAALLFRLRRMSGYIIALFLGIYVFGYYVNAALMRWIEYSFVSKSYALQQALLPLYRPFSALLAIYVVTISMRNLFRWSYSFPKRQR